MHTVLCVHWYHSKIQCYFFIILYVQCLESRRCVLSYCSSMQRLKTKLRSCLMRTRTIALATLVFFTPSYASLHRYQFHSTLRYLRVSTSAPHLVYPCVLLDPDWLLFHDFTWLMFLALLNFMPDFTNALSPKWVVYTKLLKEPSAFLHSFVHSVLKFILSNRKAPFMVLLPLPQVCNVFCSTLLARLLKLCSETMLLPITATYKY